MRVWTTNFLSEVITRDESLFCVCAPDTKQCYLYVGTSNKAAVIPMEDSIIYMSKNGEAGRIKLREHVYCFLLTASQCFTQSLFFCAKL